VPGYRSFDAGSSVALPGGRQERSRSSMKATSATGFKYLRSRDFPIYLLAGWWVFWLAASYTDLSEFIPPSGATLAQFMLLVVAFLFGHHMIKRLRAHGFGARPTHTRSFHVASSTRMRVALRSAALICAALLLASLYLSGAFVSDFIEYFTKLRMDEDGLESLTGNHTLDVLTKILAFPLSYTVILVVLANGVKHFRFTLLLCILNLLAFSYLWQVNYPIIHLFWFMVFHSLLQARRRGSFDMRGMVIVMVVFSTLLASAANRFGGDIVGGLQRYIVGYHLIGFSFYDHQYQNPNSILHLHSFGRSSLGFLDQMVQVASKMVGTNYQAASLENSAYNIDSVDIGLHEIKEVNAFGTLLFSLYRDFHLAGVLVGGLLYGALTTHALYRSANNWVCGTLFMILAASWMMGMMVNPLEQPYFWFAVITLGAFALLNQGVRRRKVSIHYISPTRTLIKHLP
jgi:oligosaccharide repeat unit polymerase